MRTPVRHSARRRGIALLLVMVLVATVTVVGFAYVRAASLQAVSSKNLATAGRARYLAEGGLQHGLYMLRTNGAAVAGSSKANPLGPYFADATNDYYTFYCAVGADANGVSTLSAEANCAGVIQRSSLVAQTSNVYSQRVLAGSPLSYWRFNERSGTTTTDQKGAHSGWYMNGPLLGQTGALAGDSDCCAYFDGVNDYVNTNSWDLPVSVVTVTAWFKATTTDLDNRFLICRARNTGSGGINWGFGLTVTNGHARLEFHLRSNNPVILGASSGDIDPNVWVFGAAVYDGSNMILYKDGVEVGRTPNSGTIRTDSVAVWIGGYPPTATNRPWKGYIDEMAIYSRALSQEILSLYAAKLPTVTILEWKD